MTLMPSPAARAEPPWISSLLPFSIIRLCPAGKMIPAAEDAAPVSIVYTGVPPDPMMSAGLRTQSTSPPQEKMYSRMGFLYSAGIPRPSIWFNSKTETTR